MSIASPASNTGPWGHGFDVSMIMPKPLSRAYDTISGAILFRIRLPISCCWVPNSSCASCTARSKSFCLLSICFFRLASASSFSLSCCVLSCFFKPSSSSFWLFSSFCLGSNFFCRAATSRCPSLLPKMAPSMLMAPTFVPVMGPGAVAAFEAAGLAGAADGVAALPVWANAENVNVTTTARRTRKNLLVIGSVELLGTWFRE